MYKLTSIALILFATLFVVPSTHADEASVRKVLAEYVEVFNQKAADKVAGFWTEQGTHTDRETGERTEGRQAIQADMAKVFESSGEMKLSAKVDRFKMVTSNVARAEGQTTVVFADGEPIVSSFIAILVHEGDKWLLDSIEEMALPQPVSTADALKGLEWLIGEWVDDSGDVKVSTTFRWTANQAFMLRSFNVETKEGVTMTGTQVIGWDPRIQQIRSWSFNSDGSFGEAVWSRNGNGWQSKAIQTLANGGSASGTYVMERVDDNSFTMQLVGHELNGEPQPTGAGVKIVRAVQTPVSAASPTK
jgi:uncharacterized protein (TIGR02246 family)